MKRCMTFIIIAGLCAATLLVVPAKIRLQEKSKFQRKARPIANNYIVVLEDWGTDQRGENSFAPSVARDLTAVYGGKVKQVYKHALQGFSAEMSEEAALALSLDPRVRFVEQDGEVHATTVQANAPWGNDRIDQRDRPLDSQYTYTATGKYVNVYVIDTGIRTTHTQFSGRAIAGMFSIQDGNKNTDCNGHGTHVAGIVGGSTYGAAKMVNLIAVRVLDCSGNGTDSTVIEGVDWVTANAVHPAVANMSLGGGPSTALDNAVRNSINSGITYTIAAGNDYGGDACFESPGRVTEAITVGSSTVTDAKSDFSNIGNCVDIFAPGSTIVSAWNTSNTATRAMSGTSMAAPRVAGVAAMYLQNNSNASPATVGNEIIANATSGRLTAIGAGSPNLLLYSNY